MAISISLTNSSVSGTPCGASSCPLTIGESVDVLVALSLIRGTNNLTLSSQLVSTSCEPTINRFTIGSVLLPSWIAVSPGPAGVISKSNFTADTATFSLGQLVNGPPAGDTTSGPNVVTFLGRITIADNAVNSAGDSFMVTAVGSMELPFTAKLPFSVSIVEPDLVSTLETVTLDTLYDQDGYVLSQRSEYTLFIAHSSLSTSAAYNFTGSIVISDDDFKIDVASYMSNIALRSKNATAVTFDVATLALGENITLKFLANHSTVLFFDDFSLTLSVKSASNPTAAARIYQDTTVFSLAMTDNAILHDVDFQDSFAATTGFDIAVGEEVLMMVAVSLPLNATAPLPLKIRVDIDPASGITIPSALSFRVGSNLLAAIPAPSPLRLNTSNSLDNSFEASFGDISLVAAATEHISSGRVLVNFTLGFSDLNLPNPIVTFAPVRVTISYGSVALIDSFPFRIVDPSIAVDSTISNESLVPGSTIDYTVTIAHGAISTGPALNTSLTITLPADLTVVSMTNVSSLSNFSLSRSSGVVTLAVPSTWGLSQGINITFTFMVKTKPAPGLAFEATANLVYSSDLSSDARIHSSNYLLRIGAIPRASISVPGMISSLFPPRHVRIFIS